MGFTSCSVGVTFIELSGVIKFKSSTWLTEGKRPTFSLHTADRMLVFSIVRMILIQKKKIQYSLEMVHWTNATQTEGGVHWSTNLLISTSFALASPKPELLLYWFKSTCVKTCDSAIDLVDSVGNKFDDVSWSIPVSAFYRFVCVCVEIFQILKMPFNGICSFFPRRINSPLKHLWNVSDWKMCHCFELPKMNCYRCAVHVSGMCMPSIWLCLPLCVSVYPLQLLRYRWFWTINAKRFSIYCMKSPL